MSAHTVQEVAGPEGMRVHLISSETAPGSILLRIRQVAEETTVFLRIGASGKVQATATVRKVDEPATSAPLSSAETEPVSSNAKPLRLERISARALSTELDGSTAVSDAEDPASGLPTTQDDQAPAGDDNDAEERTHSRASTPLSSREDDLKEVLKLYGYDVSSDEDNDNDSDVANWRLMMPESPYCDSVMPPCTQPRPPVPNYDSDGADADDEEGLVGDELADGQYGGGRSDRQWDYDWEANMLPAEQDDPYRTLPYRASEEDELDAEDELHAEDDVGEQERDGAAQESDDGAHELVNAPPRISRKRKFTDLDEDPQVTPDAEAASTSAASPSGSAAQTEDEPERKRRRTGKPTKADFGPEVLAAFFMRLNSPTPFKPIYPDGYLEAMAASDSDD
ncbi:hypothetical protein HDZ31DRAFT_61376 [Schizophyllum fasciatum]